MGKSVTLNKLGTGCRAIVSGISIENKALCNKLLTMGVVAGTMIEVLRIAPLGDPMKIRAMGYKLSLRLSEAAQVIVTPVA